MKKFRTGIKELSYSLLLVFLLMPQSHGKISSKESISPTAGIFSAIGSISASTSPAFATGTKTPWKAFKIPQNWCFCLQFREGVPPYSLSRVTGFSPECDKMKYQPAGQDPWAELYSCEDVKKC
ncbi:hypothetical protein HY772_00570 [Candidatus Woesearchaeota archaeon]|nr:hypothetical protein [Candidatus Woesearchaeota archaeon]